MFGVGTKNICRYSYQKKHSQCKVCERHYYTKKPSPDEKYWNKKRIAHITIPAVPAKTSLRLQLFLENYLCFLGSELIERINKSHSAKKSLE